MASTVYNLFKKTMQQKLIELKFCRIFVSYELKLHKPDGTEIIWKKNIGIPKIDIGNLSDFWYYLYKHFIDYIEEMKRREYEIPVQFIKIDLHIFKFNPF